MIRFADGFHVYQDSSLSRVWTSITGTPSIGINWNRQYGNRGVELTSPGTFPDSVTQVLDDQATWIVNFAMLSIPGNPPVNRTFLRILDVTTEQIHFDVTASGKIQVLRGSTVLATSTNSIMKLTVYKEFEVKFTISDTVGAVEIRINEQTVINITNQDTQVSGNSTADTIQLYNSSSTCDNWFSDVVIMDTSGSINNDFIGSVHMDHNKPNGNGNSSNFTGSDADSTNNYLHVDEDSYLSAPDDDTSYVESSTVTDRDDYAVVNGHFRTDDIIAVVVRVQARKDDGGTRSIDLYTRISSTDYDAAIDEALTTSYATYEYIWELNPATSLVWDLTAFDAATFGIEVSA